MHLFIPIGRSLISAKFRVYNSLLKRAITGRNKICRLNYVLNISCPLETFTRQTRQQLIFLLRAAIQLINIKLPSGIDISLCYDYPVITILLSLSSRNFPCHLQTGKRLVEFVKKDHEQENFRYALANLANTLFLFIWRELTLSLKSSSACLGERFRSLPSALLTSPHLSTRLWEYLVVQ